MTSLSPLQPAAVPADSPSGVPPAPLSFAQERFWRRREREREGLVSSVPVVLRLSGPLAAAALRRALAAVVERHEALRTTFGEVGGRAIQIVGPALGPAPPLVDLARLPPALHEREVMRAVLQDGDTAFDLTIGPLVRWRLFRCAPEEHVLTCVFHHIAFDGWSGAIFTAELLALYGAFRRGAPSPLPPLPVQVQEHARWQRHPDREARLERQRAFWRETLRGAAAPDLAALAPRAGVTRHRGRAASEPVAVAAHLCGAVRTLGAGCGATLFMTLLAAFQAALGGATGRRDVTVTSLYANRVRPGVARLIGSFFTSLPLRVRIDGRGFRSLLAQVREATLAAYDNADVLFEEVLEEMGAGGEDPAAAFRVRFALQTPPAAAVNGCGLAIAEVPFDSGRIRQDLALLLSPQGDGLAGRLRYDAGVLAAPAVASLRNGFLQVLNHAVLDPDRPMDELVAPLRVRAAVTQSKHWTLSSKGRFHMLHESVATPATAPPIVPAIIDQLKTILADDLDINLKREEIDENASLLEEGLALDSVVIIELIGHIESRFGFQFGDENLRTELFRSLTTLAEFIAAQTAPAELGV